MHLAFTNSFSSFLLDIPETVSIMLVANICLYILYIPAYAYQNQNVNLNKFCVSHDFCVLLFYCNFCFCKTCLQQVIYLYINSASYIAFSKLYI